MNEEFDFLEGQRESVRDNLQKLREEVIKLKRSIDLEEEKLVLLGVSELKELALIDKHLRTLRAVFSLDDQEFNNLIEIGLFFYPEESAALVADRVRDQRNAGLKKMEVVLRGEVDIAFLPKADQQFYNDLAEKYPDKLYTELVEVAHRFKKGGSKQLLEDQEEYPEPKGEALKLIWAALLHPDGPSLQKEVVMKRTRLSERAVRPFLDGCLQVLQRNWSDQIDDEAEPEVIELCQNLHKKWPDRTLQEIVVSIPGRDIKLKFLDEETGEEIVSE